MKGFESGLLGMLGTSEVIVISLVLLITGGLVVVAAAFVLWHASRYGVRQLFGPKPPPLTPPTPTPPIQDGAKLPGSCPRCGTPVSAGLVHGRCPKCALSAGFETGPEGTLATDSQVAASTTPKPSDLKAYFPQLEIVEFIGQGGMGWVYLARQLNLDRRVALKVLPPDSGRDPFFAERFRREARALAQLNHPNIVGIHDIGQAGPYFHLVLEYVEGSNLRQLERTRRFTPSEALAIIPRICDALQYAHEAGIVHRDIKPENILIDRKGRVKITDFGIAKIVGKQPDITLTNPGDRVGTPHYMAPEQMGSPGDVDHRADIYALGVVFYEMLTGELPLGRFDSPSQKVPMDVRMDDIVLKSLEQDRERRYQSADAVKTDVETVASQPAIASGG